MILLSNIKAVKNSNMKGMANFGIVDLERLNLEKIVREIGEERVGKILKNNSRK